MKSRPNFLDTGSPKSRRHLTESRRVHDAAEPHEALPSLTIALADGSRWTIIGTDDLASQTVLGLGDAMCLKRGTEGRELYVVTCRDRCHDAQKPSPKGAAVCWLHPVLDRSLRAIHVEKTARQIALESLTRGGLLLHGALAEYRGAGYLMAGPSGVGKSTASSRLPPPHRSLCDDRTLVVRDNRGLYWAHPWPTWSQLLKGKPTGSRPVEDAVPLRGIFFLSQSTSERLQPTARTQAAALIMESAIDLVREIARLSEAGESRDLWRDHLAAAKALAAAVPAHSLQVSLQGQFWKEIEQVLPSAGNLGVHSPAVGQRRVSPGADAHGSSSYAPEAHNGRLRAVCLGRAMNPTLAEADILEVEPYDRRRVRPGDVVCFKSPENAETTVRRVVSVEGRGARDEGLGDVIRTRGDNNRHNDPWLLRSGDIDGQVVAARRESRWRQINGGLHGQAVACLMKSLVPLRTFSHRLRDLAVGVGPFPKVLPWHLQPRAVEFIGRRRLNLKLLSGDRQIGRYDGFSQDWRIRRPFRVFVDPSRLPAPPRWSYPSFVGARYALRPRHLSVIPTGPKTVFAAGCSDSVRGDTPEPSASS